MQDTDRMPWTTAPRTADAPLAWPAMAKESDNASLYNKIEIETYLVMHV